jgi:hypothetical protein
VPENLRSIFVIVAVVAAMDRATSNCGDMNKGAESLFLPISIDSVRVGAKAFLINSPPLLDSGGREISPDLHQRVIAADFLICSPLLLESPSEHWLHGAKHSTIEGLSFICMTGRDEPQLYAKASRLFLDLVGAVG